MIGVARFLGELALGLAALAAVYFTCRLVWAGIKAIIQDRRTYK